MKKEEVQKLADMARIDITDTESASLAEDITAIIGYVSEIDHITSETGVVKKVGAVHNIMREDEAPHEAGMYTDDLLDSAAGREGQYIKVKKILGE